MATPKKTTKKTTDTKTAKKITPKEILAILKAKYDEVFDDGGVYTIKGNGKWGFADANGDVKIKPCFSALGEEWCDNIIVTYGSGGLGFVNKKLEEIALRAIFKKVWLQLSRKVVNGALSTRKARQSHL